MDKVEILLVCIDVIGVVMFVFELGVIYMLDVVILWILDVVLVVEIGVVYEMFWVNLIFYVLE